MAQSIHDFHDDPRNAAIRIWINGRLLPREQAMVSVFDSGFVLGDGVWEGLRVVGGHPVFLDAHLDRLYEGAKAIALRIGVVIEPFALTVMVLVAALPSASNVSLLAERFGADNGRIARIILVTTAAAFLTFSGAVALLQP